MPKKILCFGDSNTYGFVPGEGVRYKKSVRWTGVLADCLGEGYKVFEGGCNNRVCFSNHPDGKKFIGNEFIYKYLPYDIDIIITCLGANDLQKNYHNSFSDLEKGFYEYILGIKMVFNSKIIILAPPFINKEVVKNEFFKELFDEKSVEMSMFLPEIWKKVAKSTDCYFLNLNLLTDVSKADGLHYTSDSHRVIGVELAKFITQNKF